MGKRLVADWRCLLGEAAVEIRSGYLLQGTSQIGGRGALGALGQGPMELLAQGSPARSLPWPSCLPQAP